MKANGISLVINTKNEEKNIENCISSAKSIVDEIIVVDMQSSDRTVEIAKKLGAKIYSVKDYGHAEPARNFALSKASNKWTLLLDGDERLTEKLRNTIIKLVKKNRYDGFQFPFKNLLLGKWIKHSMWWPDYHIRLFKTGHLDWPKGVHQDIKFTGEVFTLKPVEDNAFIHHNIDDVKEMLEMVDQYSSVETKFQLKKNISPDDLIEYLNKEFTWRYFDHKGYLDGMHGFILAKFMDVYRLLEVAKFWERNGYKEMFAHIKLKEAVERYYTAEKLKADLEKIQSSKFYQAWQIYCKLKDLVKKIL